MEQHEIVASRFQDGPLNELYAIIGRNDKEREALTEWITKYVHHITVVSSGRVTTRAAQIRAGSSQIQWGYSRDSGQTTLNFYTIKL